jgi:hypothetical protein
MFCFRTQCIQNKRFEKSSCAENALENSQSSLVSSVLLELGHWTHITI